MAKKLTDNDISMLFAKKHWQDGIQACGIGSLDGKKCIRVIVFRPKASLVKLPKSFMGLKINIVLADGEVRALGLTK